MTITSPAVLPTIGFASNRASVREGDDGLTQASLLIALSAPSAVPVTVTYSTVGPRNYGSATAGVDYQRLTAELVFAPGETAKYASVAVIGDRDYESAETFFVDILGASGATVAAAVADNAAPSPYAMVTIANDDMPALPTVALVDSHLSTVEGNAGTHPLTFTVTLSAPSAVAVTALYATIDRAGGDVAKPVADYLATQGELVFAPGELSKTFSVDIVGDTVHEEDEFVSVVLTGASGALVVKPNAEDNRYDMVAATIVDDDPATAWTVGFTAGNTIVTEGDSGVQHVTLTVQLSAASPTPVSVRYLTEGPPGPLPATPGADYVAASGMLVFAPGERTKTIVVDVIGDLVHEDFETISVALYAPVGAAIVAAGTSFKQYPSIQVIIADNDAPHPNVAASGTLAIDGALVVGRTVSAVDSIVDPDGIGVLAYRWFADGVLVAGGASNSLLLTPALAGKSLSVIASYTDTYGASEAVSSAQSALVIGANHAPTGSVTLSAPAGAGAIVSALASLDDADGIGALHYLWQASADGAAWTSIAGAEAGTLALAPALAGRQVRVAVSYTDAHGSVETVLSAALGTAAADRLAGTPLHDNILAGGGNDVIVASGGGDSIDGGAGLDTVAYAAPAGSFRIAAAGALLTVTELAGAHAVDTLSNVERLAFADADIGVDSVASQAYRLYQAAFNRAPDRAGLGYWISQMDHGASLREVAAQFIASNEFKLAYGSDPANAAIVASLYQNVLHRAGDATGIAFRTGVLDAKADTLAGVLAGFSESTENQVALVGVTGSGVTFTHFA